MQKAVKKEAGLHPPMAKTGGDLQPRGRWASVGGKLLRGDIEGVCVGVLLSPPGRILAEGGPGLQRWGLRVSIRYQGWGILTTLIWWDSCYNPARQAEDRAASDRGPRGAWLKLGISTSG